MKHLLSINDIDNDKIFELFNLAENIESNKLKYYNKCKNKVVANLFFEPSTRTFASFFSASTKLGASVIPVVGVNYSSIMKGESLEDTVKTFSQYCDLIVMRHPERGSVFKSSKYSDVTIINAGDGDGEHPTQALLDLYTIYREKNRIENLKICFIGDLKYSRTVHSLVKLLRRFKNNQLIFFSPKGLEIEDSLIEVNDIFIKDFNNNFISDIDVFYVTRIQKERHKIEICMGFDYTIDENFLNLISKKAIIMHPLPRVDEISRNVDKDERAVYFKQVKYGLYIRMAILYDFLSKN